MKKLQNQLLFRYNVKYCSLTRDIQKKLEKNFLIKLKNDELKSLIETRKKKINQLNCKKISALLISNFISSIKHNKQIVISMDDHVLTDKNISCKLYKAIINRLLQADMVQIKKGFYSNSMIDYQHPYRISQRTRLIVKDKLRSYIVEFFARNNIDLLSIIKESKIKRVQPSLVEDKAVQVQPKAEMAKPAQNGLKTQINTIQDKDNIIHISNAELTPINNNGIIKIKIKDKDKGTEKYITLDKTNDNEMKMLNLVLNCKHYHITNDYQVQYQGDKLLDIYSNYTEQLMNAIKNEK